MAILEKGHALRTDYAPVLAKIKIFKLRERIQDLTDQLTDLQRKQASVVELSALSEQQAAEIQRLRAVVQQQNQLRQQIYIQKSANARLQADNIQLRQFAETVADQNARLKDQLARQEATVERHRKQHQRSHQLYQRKLKRIKQSESLRRAKSTSRQIQTEVLVHQRIDQVSKDMQLSRQQLICEVGCNTIQVKTKSAQAQTQQRQAMIRARRIIGLTSQDQHSSHPKTLKSQAAATSEADDAFLLLALNIQAKGYGHKAVRDLCRQYFEQSDLGSFSDMLQLQPFGLRSSADRKVIEQWLGKHQNSDKVQSLLTGIGKLMPEPQAKMQQRLSAALRRGKQGSQQMQEGLRQLFLARQTRISRVYGMLMERGLLHSEARTILKALAGQCEGSGQVNLGQLRNLLQSLD